MAYTSGFFDAVDQGGGNYDRVYSAANFAHYFSLLVQNGVFPNPSTGMQVKASSSPDMHVSVQSGSGWVNGYYITVSDSSPEQLTIPTANPSLSRIDSVIMGLNYVQREIQLYIKSGAVSASPSAVSLQRDNDLYELELAQITVAAGVASISQANITDMRSNTSRCGIVKGTIDQIDTTDLFAQYDAAFQTWFDNLKAQLGDNVASNLQNQINTLKDDKVNVADKASKAQAQAGKDDTKWMTPEKVANEIENLSYLRNKILSNNTAALFALDPNATPDNVLAKIGGFTFGWRLLKAYKTAGTYEFEVPSGVHEIGVYMMGGGGSGSVTYTTSSTYHNISGGASGYGKNVIFHVQPGQKIQIVVGAGGAPAVSKSAGNNGGSTSVNGVSVSGGMGGLLSQSTNTPVKGGQGPTTQNSGSLPLYGSRLLPVTSQNGAIIAIDAGTDQTPDESQNMFDPTMVSLCAGGNATAGGNPSTEKVCVEILAMPDGTKGGNGYAIPSTKTPAGAHATGNGNGGGAIISADYSQSGRGSDGAVYIYTRGAA